MLVHGEGSTDIDFSATVEAFLEIKIADDSNLEVDMKISKVTEKLLNQAIGFYLR